MEENEDVAIIPIEDIIDPKFLLRCVNKRSVEYLEMLDSIERTGLWNSIAVRPAGARAPGKYEVVDGFYRLSCCRDLKRETIPCIIREGLSDQDVLAAQIRANAVRPETTTIEFARQLKRIRTICPTITLPEMARLVNKNPSWISKQLSLLNLPEDIQVWVDRGEIPISSAYMLSKVPPRYMREMAPHARVMTVNEFADWSAGIIKDYMENVRRGKIERRFKEAAFTPQPHLRSLKKVLHELETQEEAGMVIMTENAKTPIAGFMAGLKWAANLDRESVRQQEKDYLARQRKVDLRKMYQEHVEEDVDDEDPP